MRKIIANQKGGVGKTTATANVELSGLEVSLLFHTLVDG